MKEKKTILFEFRNQLGCTGTIALMNNMTDSFRVPNLKSVNVGNQMTILGANGNAYKGNTGTGTADCSLVNTTNVFSNIEIKTFPNPVTDMLIVDLMKISKNQNLLIKIVNNTGKQVVAKQKIVLNVGDNQVILNTEKLIAGSYYVVLENEHEQFKSSVFVKM